MNAMGAADKKVLLSFDEVSLHKDAKDCWVVVNAKAYDVTNFLTDHPGGEEVLLAVAGTDASQEFEDAGHGSAARLMLDEFYKGEIGPSPPPPPPLATYAPPRQPLNDNEEKSPAAFMATFNDNLRFLVPLIALLFVAVGVRLYT